MDEPDEPVEFRDVEVLEDTGFTISCRIHGVRVTIPALFILPGSTVWSRGDRGTLVIPRRIAAEAGLL